MARVEACVSQLVLRARLLRAPHKSCRARLSTERSIVYPIAGMSYHTGYVYDLDDGAAGCVFLLGVPSMPSMSEEEQASGTIGKQIKHTLCSYFFAKGDT